LPPFWRVNSYGYPNPFGPTNAIEAWQTFESFATNHSYEALKKYWSSGNGPRVLDQHTVESWKATFEEFGLLYVLSREDDVVITPGGNQIIKAVAAKDQKEFVRLTFNLLLRYPLKGPPRRGRGEPFDSSDLLLYRALYAAILDLEGYLLWTELERVLCYCFSRAAVRSAVDLIAALRLNPTEISKYDLPSESRGAFYNSLNQVMVHASLYYTVVDNVNVSSPYTGTHERRHSLIGEWLPIVSEGLGGETMPSECNGTFLSRLPSAPGFSTEEQYFAYIGAEVPPSNSLPGVKTVELGSDIVAVLQIGVHCSRTSSGIQGPAAVCCGLSEGQRVIVTDDFNWTWIVEGKSLGSAPGTVSVRLRRARPIVDASPVLKLLGAPNGESKGK
jgi:hypothetical protein